MEEQLRAALAMNVELLQRVAALQIVATALLRSMLDDVRRAAEDRAAITAAAAVGRHGIEAERIQTLVEEILMESDPGPRGSPSPP